jgi:hypothetical protein
MKYIVKPVSGVMILNSNIRHRTMTTVQTTFTFAFMLFTQSRNLIKNMRTEISFKTFSKLGYESDEAYLWGVNLHKII